MIFMKGLKTGANPTFKPKNFLFENDGEAWEISDIAELIKDQELNAKLIKKSDVLRCENFPLRIL